MKRSTLGKFCCLLTAALSLSLGGCSDQGNLNEGVPKDAPTQAGPPDDVKQMEKDMMNAPKKAPVKDPNKP